MSTINGEAVLEQLQWRYAVKRFDPARKVAPELWAQLEQAMVLAPSSYGFQPWKFVVVSSDQMKAKLKPAAFNQAQITDCSHLVVLCHRTNMAGSDVERYLARIAEVRKTPYEKLDGFKKMLMDFVEKPVGESGLGAWASRQCYIALGFLLAACAMTGVDACPMEGFEGPKFDEILGLREKGYASVALAAVGYRSDDDPAAKQPKVRYDVVSVVERQ